MWYPVEGRRRRLGLHIKGPDGFDILTKKFNAYRVRLPWREHVKNPSTQGKFAYRFNHRDAAIATLHQGGGKL